MSRLLLALSSTLLALGVCELAVRVLDLGPEIASVNAGVFKLSSNPVLQYELQPGRHGRGDWINEEGMRDRPFSRSKPPGTYRIAVIGDSITQGYRVRPEQTYPKVLERLLDEYVEGEVDFEVLNFGVVGYSIPQIVENLRVKALQFDPDLVVYGYCLNDPEPYNPFARMLRQRLESHDRGYLDRLAGGHLRLWALARYLLEARRGGEVAEVDEEAVWGDDPGYLAFHGGARTYESYISRLHEAEQTWGGVASGLDRLGELAREHELRIAVALFPLMKRLESYPLGPVHRKLTHAAERSGLSALDLTPVFAAASADEQWRWTLGVDRVHPTPTGHGLAGLALLFWLDESAILPSGTELRHDRLVSEVPGAALVRTAMAPAIGEL